uniref:Uncharacterized protein n=1 Tax=Timema cristinae TaxID=61476 RepID=A0A7R9CSK3_TIMCR|nr:unnamed protein product [Timema cristinae]
MRQAHNSQVLHNHPLTPSDGDGYSGGGGLLANGTGVHSKFTREFGAMLENGGGVTGSNHSGAGSKMNGDVSVIGENGVDENYTGFPGNDNCRHNGYLDYGAEPAEDDQITDDLGFDPFHETQKALAEMMEKESIMMQSGQQLQHHNHILPQQYRQHMPTQLSFPPGGSGSKLLSAYTSQQQNHRLSQNMSVSACTKLLDGLGLGQVPSPAPRARLPPPGFPTAPNHMNAFGLGIPRAPSSTGSKILPFMGLGSNPSTNTPNGNPPSPTALYAVAPSYGGLLGSKQPGDAWPDSLRSMLPGVNTGGPTPPPSSQGVMFATHTHTHTQKGWNGVSPCTDWTVLDPAIVSSSRSHNFPPSNTPLHWQDTSTAPLFYAGGAEWGSGSNPAPPPGFSLRQNSAASSVPPPEIESLMVPDSGTLYVHQGLGSQAKTHPDSITHHMRRPSLNVICAIQ